MKLLSAKTYEREVRILQQILTRIDNPQIGIYRSFDDRRLLIQINEFFAWTVSMVT